MGMEVSGASELYHVNAMCECIGRCITRAYEWNGSTAATTSIEARLTFTIKLALDADHTDILLVNDLLLELASGEQVKGID